MRKALPLPEYWPPVVRIVLALRALLKATPPEAYAALAVAVQRQLAYAGAYVRRYLLAVARQLSLPPPQPPLPSAPAPPPPRPATGPRRRPLDTPFALDETLPEWRRQRSGLPAAPLTAYERWALAWQRVEALIAVLREPLPAARRLARRLARGAGPVLRAMPVRWHVLRALPPADDVRLMDLDRLARPEAWHGLAPDTS